MARISSLFAGFMAVVLVATLALHHSLGDIALRRGRELYEHRINSRRMVDQPAPRRRFIAWLGDSTIWDMQKSPYPRLLTSRLLRRSGTVSRVFALPGYNVFAYYCMIGRIIDEKPAAIVLILNFRLLQPPGPAFNDLVSFLPTRELPRALTLPLYAQGISGPHLLVVRLLRFGTVEKWAFEAEGMRSLLQERVRGRAAVATRRRTRQFRRRRGGLRSYRVDLSPWSPVVRLLAASVRMASERHVAVLAVVTPIPWQAMQRAGLYDEGRFRRRVGVLRAAVEAAGGVLVDLHGALGAESFRESEHFNPAGAARMADLVAPHVEKILRSVPPFLGKRE